MKELIKKNKIIIGMVHFPPLPGTPNFNDDKNLSKIVNSISSDLDSLQNNGIDAVMFGNEGDRPYLLKASNETLSAMAYVIGLIKNKIKVPFGVNYLWDPVATVALGSICNANFVREVFTGVYDSDMGLWEPKAAEAVRLRTNLHRKDMIDLPVSSMDSPEMKFENEFIFSSSRFNSILKDLNLIDGCKLLFNVNAEFASPLGTRSTAEKSESAYFSSLADAICVSGVITSKSVNLEE